MKDPTEDYYLSRVDQSGLEEEEEDDDETPDH